MSGPNDYPKTMQHPNARKGTAKEVKGNDPTTGRAFTDYQGTPDMLPPVTVHDSRQEQEYRARGYLLNGESPAPPVGYFEYPVMLSHPEHVEAKPGDTIAEKTADGVIRFIPVPGTPEKFPPKQANNAAEEAALAKKGYRRAAVADPESFRRAHASPYDPDRVNNEFPKYVDGVLVDPHAPDGRPQEYPKWVGDLVVNTAEEERALTGTAPPKPVELCVICGEEISDDDPANEGPRGKYHLVHFATPSQPAREEERRAEAPMPPPMIDKAAARKAKAEKKKRLKEARKRAWETRKRNAAAKSSAKP